MGWGHFGKLVISNLESLTTIQPEFLPLYIQLEYEMNRPLLARLWRSRSPVNYTMYLAQSLGEYMDHYSSKMNGMLLSTSSDHPPIPFCENPLYQSPSRASLDGNCWYCEVLFLHQWPDVLPQASFSYSGHIVDFSLFSCEGLLLSQHTAFWALTSMIQWLPCSGRDQLTVLSLIHLHNHKQKVKQTPFRTCAVFILSTALRLGNNQCN